MPPACPPRLDHIPTQALPLTSIPAGTLKRSRTREVKLDHVVTSEKLGPQAACRTVRLYVQR
eukprot:762521-Hanusia_phi.AAC.35